MTKAKNEFKAPATPLKDWMVAAAAAGNGGHVPAYKRLPKEALEEINAVIAYNDAHPGKEISATKMCNRIYDQFDIKLGHDQLKKYLNDVLKRRGWLAGTQ